MRAAPLGLSLFAMLASAPAVAAPNVVVSFKPLHSLVAGVMEGVAEPELLIEGAQSAHGFSLRPSDAAKLEAADMVFWIGPALETFLTDPLTTLAADADAIAMIEVDGMEVLPARDGGLFEGHDHGDEASAEDDHDHAHEEGHDHDSEADHDHDHAEAAAGDHAHAVDAHIWLDPDNARLMVAAITEALVTADPENAEAYDANGRAMVQELTALDREIAASLEGLGETPWFAFHDAYHSFESHYGVEATGSFTINPEIAPGAARLVEIRDAVTEAGAACIFAEPNFSSSVIDTIAAETGAQIGVLDPHGATLEPGPDLYFALMRNIATGLNDCLRG